MNAQSQRPPSQHPQRQGERFGRNAAIAVLGGFLVVLAAVAALPHIWSFDLTRQIDEQSDAARNLERQALRLGNSKQRLTALSNPKIAKAMLLQGSTAGLNGAQLQKRVLKMATSAGIRPQSLRVSDPQKWQEGLRNISLEIGMRAKLKQIQNLVFNIETQLPLMFIETMTVAHPEGQQSVGNGSGPLDVSITVRGIALAGNTP